MSEEAGDGIRGDIPIHIPSGEFASPHIDGNNGHPIVPHELDIPGLPRRADMIHQVREGDCILANFLNTYSLERMGRLPMTINEARLQAIDMRKGEHRDHADIVEPDSSLDYKDVINLFSKIYGVSPRQEDLETVEGQGKTQRELELAALNILDKLDTYPSGLVTTGMGFHSRTIKRLPGDNYAIIDPMNPRGLQLANTLGVIAVLDALMVDHPANENFFFFIRK